jgi:hypothetical protein
VAVTVPQAGQWRFLLDRSVAVPVTNRSVAIPDRQVSGSFCYIDRSVTLPVRSVAVPVIQTGSLAALSL